METTTDAGSVASSTELLNPCSTPLVGCGMVNASDRAGFRGRLQSRIVRRGDPHELRNRPLDTQSLINGTAHEPLQLHPDARRDARRLSCRGSGLWGYGLEEGGYVAQVYVSVVRFFQPQKRLISEEHVGLFRSEPTGSSGLEAFSDQAAGSSAILFDRPTHEGNALRVLRSFWLYEPDRCDRFHCRKHSDAVAHAKTDKTPCLSRLAAKQPVRHLRRLQQATYNPLKLRPILDRSGDHHPRHSHRARSGTNDCRASSEARGGSSRWISSRVGRLGHCGRDASP